MPTAPMPTSPEAEGGASSAAGPCTAAGCGGRPGELPKSNDTTAAGVASEVPLSAASAAPEVNSADGPPSMSPLSDRKAASMKSAEK